MNNEKFGELLFKEIKEVRKDVAGVKEEVSNLKSSVSVLKVKMTFIGSIAGSVITVVANHFLKS
jgi:hypothetical protein